MNYVKTIINDIEMVSWSEGTDSQIIKMINGYYNNLLTIDDIKSVWYLGDFRNFDLTNFEPFYPISYSGVSSDDSYAAWYYENHPYIETHANQTVQMRIVGFEHDDLVVPINGHNKALISLIQMGPLKSKQDNKEWDWNTQKYIIVTRMKPESGIYDDQYILNSKDKYLPQNFNWGESRRRQWCNNNYYMSIPTKFRKIIKKVFKKNRCGNFFNDVINTEDYIWLPSGSEVSESSNYLDEGNLSGYLDEGNLYEFNHLIDYRADYNDDYYTGMMLRTLQTNRYNTYSLKNVLLDDSLVISIDQAYWFWDFYYSGNHLRFRDNNRNGFGTITMNFELEPNKTYFINSNIEVFDYYRNDEITFTLKSNSVSYDGFYKYDNWSSDNHHMWGPYIKDNTILGGYRSPYFDVSPDNTNWELVIDLTQCHSKNISIWSIVMDICLLSLVNFHNDYNYGSMYDIVLWNKTDLLPGFCI